MHVTNIMAIIKSYDKDATIEYSTTTNKFYLSSKLEAMENGMLSSKGRHNTDPAQCVIDFYKEIQGKRCAIGAYTNNRQEYDVPKLI